MKILSEVKNSLLKRKEVSAIVEVNGNPGSAKVRKMVADEMGVAEDVVAIKDIFGGFGVNEFKVNVMIYDSAEGLIKVEPKKKAKKEVAN